MAIESRRYKGVAKDGKIELEPGAVVPDGTQVTVLFPAATVSRRRRKRSTARDLLNSEIVGMWADRTDIADSAEFARDLRAKAWKRAAS